MRLPLRRSVLAGLLLVSPAFQAACRAQPATDAGAAPVREEKGEIDGAPFETALPRGPWNRKLLLVAHGLRPEASPLVPDLRPDRLAWATLLDEGWMVAGTAYRRNGMIIADAIEDLDALRARIVHDHGNPDLVVLEGEGMGGLIVTLMAERDRDLYAGALAIDPTVGARESNMTVGLSLLPKIPLLVLATERELRSAKGYVTALVERPAPTIQPVLFTVAREGRANVSQRERLAAFRALEAWLSVGPQALPRPSGAPFHDATIAADAAPSSVSPREDRTGFAARVLDVDEGTGNVTLDAQPGDFAAAGIAPMDYFRLQAGGEEYRTLLGRDYSSVRRGEWVALADGEGRITVARNDADAAATARLKTGDAVTVLRYEPNPQP